MASHDARTAGTAARARSGHRVLIVGGAPDRRHAWASQLGALSLHCTHVSRMADAEAALANGRFDVMLVHRVLPDGDGLELAEELHRSASPTKTIVLVDEAAVEDAMAAVRSGAADIMALPVDARELTDRVRAAVKQSTTDRARERRIKSLKRLCRDLNAARDDVASQVETLCNAMAATYDEFNQKIEETRVATEFRTLLAMELDLEEQLRTALEYLLAKIGPTNAAVFLPDRDGQFGLGAYVNYDCPRESVDSLLEHLGSAICDQLRDEPEIVAFDDARSFAQWVGMEDAFIADAEVLAFSCRHDDACMAVIILFRHKSAPFEESIGPTLDLLRTVFAEQLDRVVRIHHRMTPAWPDEAGGADEGYEDDYGFGGGLAA